MNLKSYLNKITAIFIGAVVYLTAGYFLLVRPVFMYWDKFEWYTLALPVIIIALIYLGYKLLIWAKTQLDTDGDGDADYDDFLTTTADVLDDLDLPSLEEIFEDVKEAIARKGQLKK